MGWLPIESAPKDGTKVDLWMVDQDGKGWRETDAYWMPVGSDTRAVYASDGTYVKMEFCKRSGWYAPGHDYDGMDGFCDKPRYFNPHPRWNREMFNEPSHWMPLPPPPGSDDEFVSVPRMVE